MIGEYKFIHNESGDVVYVKIAANMLRISDVVTVLCKNGYTFEPQQLKVTE